MRIADKAYAAGFFDGEGCVGIYHKPGLSEEHPGMLQVSIANTDREILGRMSLLFGGGVFTANSKNSHWRQAWQWSLPQKRAKRFLQEILLYLTIKQERAVLAIEFAALAAAHMRSGGLYQGRCWSCVPKKVRCRMLWIKNRICLLNKKGPRCENG